jgi:hypothetical protein
MRCAILALAVACLAAGCSNPPNTPPPPPADSGADKGTGEPKPIPPRNTPTRSTGD